MFLPNLFSAFWIFLPAALSNTTPVIAAKVPILKNFKTPMDFGLSFRGKRLLGNNKTIRGLWVGVMTAILVAYLQKLLFNNSTLLQNTINIADYSQVNILFFYV